MKSSVDWNVFAKKAAGSARRREMIGLLKTELEPMLTNFDDSPAKTSGWGHQYFCEEDGGLLVFNPKDSKHHVCSVCGRVYSGGLYDAAWIYMERYERVMSLIKAALLYKYEGERRYLDYVKTVLGFFAEHYSEFEEHGKPGSVSGLGKITPQVLNEAIFVTRIVFALELLAEDLEPAFVDMLKTKLLIPAAQFINDQPRAIHNIPCWRNTAVFIVGCYAKDQDLEYEAIDSEFGFHNQVAKGVTSDFFWYEGSIHYNCFTIEAFIFLLYFAKRYGRDFPKEQETVLNMFRTLMRYAFHSLDLPNPNDGWPSLSLKTYSFLFELARVVFGGDEIEAMLAEIYSAPCLRHPVPLSAPYYYGDYSLEWLLFGEDTYKKGRLDYAGKSQLFEGSNFGMLKNHNINAFIKYGHNGPSHAHPDKMNVEIIAFDEVITRDLSNSGYGARLCNEWHRTSLSHNTVVINGANHVSTELGKAMEFSDDYIKVLAKDVYPGFDFYRSLRIGQNTVSDFFEVVGKESAVLDWIFHSEGILSRQPYPRESASLEFKSNGYQHVQEVEKLLVSGSKLSFEWDFSGLKARMDLCVAPGATVYLAKTYDNPVTGLRTSVLVRSKDSKTEIKTDWVFNK